MMATRISFTYGENISRHQRQQSAKPKTSRLLKWISEMIGVDSLSWLLEPCIQIYRSAVLHTDFWNFAVPKFYKEVICSLPVSQSPWNLFDPTIAGKAKEPAFGMKNTHIPSIVKMIHDIPLYMRPRNLGILQITRNSIMSSFAKFFPHPTTAFASNYYSHDY
jgi:hypothetical protein